MAKQLAKPIEEINKVAINVSNLDFSIRAKEVRRKDELGSLAVNINIMADRLKGNIDYLKEANRKLELDNELMNQVDEQRKEFIANISHELKTPLAILSGYAELLNNDVPGIDKTFYFETILDETHKMDILIQSLLNLSNMENRLNDLKLVNIDIYEFAERIFRKNEILIQNNGQISSFVGQPCGSVIADPLYLEEAITNYISNAITYTEKDKLIQMSVKRSEEEVVISVFNEGGRISEEHLEKIWNSFYREDKSRTRTEQNNIGLGLYIVRSIMNAHHGKCGVENKANGVEFWISLKLH
jgi:signal transduction histidine kinase